MARLDSFLNLVVEQRASDLHLRAGHKPIVRYCGELYSLPFRVLSQEEAKRLVDEIMSDEQKAALDADQEVDFAYELPGVGRFRAQVFEHASGIGAVLRVIPPKVPTIDELGLPAVLHHLAREGNGLVLVTGPTGSGKSTTLAALIHEINLTQRRHIVTIEDPIEFLHEPIQSLVTQRQVGVHTESFASALRSALREAPDVIVIGEMRDFETVQLALSAAETGALVFATLHTRSSARAIDRILDVCAEETVAHVRSTLSAVLKGVVAQFLCRHKNGDQQIVAVEILLQNYATANMIRENKVHQLESYLLAPEHRGTGMQALDTCILELVERGTITVEEALRAATTADTIRRLSALPPPP